jgi:hypothetical protein
MRKRLLIYILQSALLLAVTTICAPADDTPISASLQAIIFKKVFEESKNYSTLGEIMLLVVNENPASGAAQEIVKAFGAVGINSKAVSSNELSKALSPKSIVYALGDVSAIKGICENSNILCISGFPSMARSGKVAISLELEANKPKIIINKTSLDAEKQEISKKVLQLAKIIE